MKASDTAFCFYSSIYYLAQAKCDQLGARKWSDPLMAKTQSNCSRRLGFSQQVTNRDIGAINQRLMLVKLIVLALGGS